MNKQVDLGKVLLPQELIDMVEKHRHNMLVAHRDDDSYDFLLKADFSLYFGDFLFKNFYKLQDN